MIARPVPAFVAEAKEYVRSHGDSGRKRHERSIRVDPRHLVVLLDYTAWLEEELAKETEGRVEDHAQATENAYKLRAKVTWLQRIVVDGSRLLTERPQWRVWSWKAWWKQIDWWITRTIGETS